MEKFSWTTIPHKRRVTTLSLASIAFPLNCNTGMDRDELLNWGAQPGNGQGHTTNDRRQSNGGGSREPTISTSHSSSPGLRNGAGGNTIESVWGNLGFDKRFDNQTKN